MLTGCVTQQLNQTVNQQFINSLHTHSLHKIKQNNSKVALNLSWSIASILYRCHISGSIFTWHAYFIQTSSYRYQLCSWETISPGKTCCVLKFIRHHAEKMLNSLDYCNTAHRRRHKVN